MTKDTRTKKKKQKRAILPTTKKLQKECDKLLTPIIKKIFPSCLLCNNPTEVAHHHCHKSKSLLLRYDLNNLINLCNSCHCRLHNNESYEASRIIRIKGVKWFDYIEKQKNKTIVANREWYQKQLSTLQLICKELGI